MYLVYVRTSSGILLRRHAEAAPPCRPAGTCAIQDGVDGPRISTLTPAAQLPCRNLIAGTVVAFSKSNNSG